MRRFTFVALTNNLVSNECDCPTPNDHSSGYTTERLNEKENTVCCHCGFCSVVVLYKLSWCIKGSGREGVVAIEQSRVYARHTVCIPRRLLLLLLLPIRYLET